MTTSLASCSAPIASAVLPGLCMMPDGGGAAGVGFTNVLELCVAPTTSLDVPMEPLVAVAMSPATSLRSWHPDSVKAEVDSSYRDDDEINSVDFPLFAEPVSAVEVPVEILALAVNPPSPPSLPEVQTIPRGSGASFGELSGGHPVDDYVTDYPLHGQADADATVAPVVDAFVVLAPSRLQPVEAVIAVPVGAAEKNAATIKPIPDRVAVVAGEMSENKFLNTDGQSDARSLKEHGIGRAKSPADMQATLDPIPAQTAFVPPRAGVSSVDTIPFVAPSSASADITNSPASTVGIAERRDVFLPATDATAVVRELAELTHEFRFRKPGSVEVKFNFKDATELSVRLAYRDGDVHATFRTNSDDLRAALDHEWQGFVANVARESGSHRIADPVFTGTNDFTDASFDREAGSNADGHARDRWQASDSNRSGSARSASPASEFRPHEPGLGLRVSSDRLLHAFA